MTRKYITTGFVDLDKSFGGIKMGDLVVLASRPGMGKSTLLANIFANNIIESKAKSFPAHCAYFSFEHNTYKVLADAASRISKFHFGAGILNKDELYSEQKMNNANEMLDKLQQEGQIGIYENDGPDATLFYIALNAAERKYKYGLDVIFIDSFHMLALYDGIKNVYSVNDWNKSENVALFYNIEIIDEAITRNRKIKFDYNKYGLDKKLHRSARHIASPYQMILHNQRYFLMAYQEKWQHISYFRLDRITNIELLEDVATDLRSIDGYKNGIDYKRFSSALPYMFSDEPEQITFAIDDEWMIF